MGLSWVKVVAVVGFVFGRITPQNSQVALQKSI